MHSWGRYANRSTKYAVRSTAVKELTPRVRADALADASTGGDRASRCSSGEDASAKEGPLERAVAVHSSAAEAGHFAGSMETRDWRAIHAEHA